MAQMTKTRTVPVTVNNCAVDLEVEPGKPEVTGAEIKTAAIAQGVAIESDFVLYLVQGHRLTPVADDEAITVHPNQKFRAVAPDDNS